MLFSTDILGHEPTTAVRMIWSASLPQTDVAAFCVKVSANAITGSSRVPGAHGRGAAKVDTGIAPLLSELDRRADAVRVGQRCTALDPAI